MSIKENVFNCWKKGLTNIEIEEETGYNQKQILYSLNRYNLKSNRYTLVKEDNKLKQFMIGSLLGDATITKVSGFANYSRFSEAHKLEHKEYLQFKFNLLKEYNLSPNKISEHKIFNSRYKNGYFEEVRFKSKVNPYFSKYRSVFYPKGIKIVPNLAKDIDAFGLSIWFMDDGNVTTYSYQLNTNGFKSEEVIFLREILKKNFNINSTQIKNKAIYILAEDRILFKSIIEPYIIPIMKYKLFTYNDRVLNKSDKLLETPEEDNQQPIINLNG